MGDLQFDDQTNEFGAPQRESAGSDITGKVVQWGLASNRQQAEYVLAGVALAIIDASFFLYKIIAGGEKLPPPQTYQANGSANF